VNCELCEGDGGELLWRGAQFRVVAVTGAEATQYRGFCRVIWNKHVREMSDLSNEEQAMFMNAVFRVESALRLSLYPDKMNLASLGNMTPHLHWHVIPRFRDDPSFPKPIWAHSDDTRPASVATLADKQEWQLAIRQAFDH
jgi:diadenosine tetraphosphate (Ap4A) HIT family hydrolase